VGNSDLSPGHCAALPHPSLALLDLPDSQGRDLAAVNEVFGQQPLLHCHFDPRPLDQWQSIRPAKD